MSGPVHRRGVEVAHPALPRRVHAIQRLPDTDLFIGDRGRAEAQTGKIDLHALTPPDTRSTRQYRCSSKNTAANGTIDTSTPTITIVYCAAWPPVMISSPYSPSVSGKSWSLPSITKGSRKLFQMPMNCNRNTVTSA